MIEILHAHRYLLRAGLSLANVFAWVFVFEYFYVVSGSISRSLAATALLYAFSQLITIVLTPVAAAFLGHGVKRSLIWSTLLASSAFVVLGATLEGYFSAPFTWGVVLFAAFLGAYRALYWVPYSVVRAETEPKRHMRFYLEFIIALMPLFAGLTMGGLLYAEGRLLFGAATIIALSALPAMLLPHVYERFSWSYVYTFKQLFRRKNHGLVMESALEGFQSAALFLVWPLAIFLILEWSYFMLGLVFTLTLLSILLLRKVWMWFVRRWDLERSPRLHVVLSVTGWISRLAAGTPVGIILADVYAYSTKPPHGMHLDPVAFEHASDRGSFVDEYTALKEIAMAAGRLMFCLLIFFLALTFVPTVVFAASLTLAAVASAIAIAVARRPAGATY